MISIYVLVAFVGGSDSKAVAFLKYSKSPPMKNPAASRRVSIAI
jgi:hypothetical protein